MAKIVGILRTCRLLIGGRQVFLCRISCHWQFLKRNLSHPGRRIRDAIQHPNPMPSLPHGYVSGGTYGDIAVHVGIENVLRGHAPIAKRRLELLKILRPVHAPQCGERVVARVRCPP